MVESEISKSNISGFCCSEMKDQCLSWWLVVFLKRCVRSSTFTDLAKVMVGLIISWKSGMEANALRFCRLRLNPDCSNCPSLSAYRWSGASLCKCSKFTVRWKYRERSRHVSLTPPLNFQKCNRSRFSLLINPPVLLAQR